MAHQSKWKQSAKYRCLRNSSHVGVVSMNDLFFLFFSFLRFNTHYHYGSSSKGNSRLLQLPCRQPESIPFLDSVHTGRSEVTLLLYISTCLNAVAELRCCLCRGYVVRLDVLFYSSFLFLIVFFLREYILHISQGSRKMLC